MSGDVELDLRDYDLFSPVTQQCPYPWLAAMRQREPVFQVDLHGRPVWLVTRYEDCSGVLTDPATFSSRFGSPGLPPSPELGARLKTLRAERGAHKFVPTLLTADPPSHTRYRRLVAKAFGPRSIARLTDDVRAIAAEVVDAWRLPTTVEFVEAFAVPLPVRVIARALNVPETDLDDFKRWSNDTMAAQGSVVSDERRLEAEAGVIEFQQYFAAAVGERRVRPRDDLLTMLIEATIDPDDPENSGLEPVPLNDAEILSILQQVLVAGNETTTNALAEMMLLLGEHPDVWNAVRTDPTARQAVVEESLRLCSPGMAMWRVATRDVELGGVTIPRGGRVLVHYGSANRDESVFAAGDEFRPQQASMQHVAFGKGSHYCVGSHLSRLEMRVALEVLGDRVGSVGVSADQELRYQPSFMLRGLESLDLDLEPAGP